MATTVSSYPTAADIMDRVSPKFHQFGLGYECIGGGRINHDSKNQKIHIYGYSVVSQREAPGLVDSGSCCSGLAPILCYYCTKSPKNLWAVLLCQGYHICSWVDLMCELDLSMDWSHAWIGLVYESVSHTSVNRLQYDEEACNSCYVIHASNFLTYSLGCFLYLTFPLPFIVCS